MNALEYLAKKQHISDIRAHAGRIGGMRVTDAKRAASRLNMLKAQKIRAEQQRYERSDADGADIPRNKPLKTQNFASGRQDGPAPVP